MSRAASTARITPESLVDLDASSTALALDRLGPVEADPTPRARRIAGIYAECYLAEPFLGSWFGLAAFAARQVHDALEGPALVWRDMMAVGNLRIYAGMVGPWLAWRATGAAPAAPALRAAYGLLAQADADLAASPAASALAWAGLVHMAHHEQRELLQPACDALDPTWREPLRHLFGFRIGLLPSAEVVSWDDDFGAPWVAEDRCAWMDARVLPAWRRAQQREPGRMRAEVDRIRREGGAG